MMERGCYNVTNYRAFIALNPEHGIKEASPQKLPQNKKRLSHWESSFKALGTVFSILPLWGLQHHAKRAELTCPAPSEAEFLAAQDRGALWLMFGLQEMLIEEWMSCRDPGSCCSTLAANQRSASSIIFKLGKRKSIEIWRNQNGKQNKLAQDKSKQIKL